MKIKKTAGLLLAVLGMASASAMADSYTVPVNGTPSGYTDLTGALSFLGFDTSRGSLTGVTINVSSQVSGIVELDNFSGAARSGIVILDATLGIGTGTQAQTYFSDNVYRLPYSLAIDDSTVIGGSKTVSGSVSYNSNLGYFLTSSVSGTASIAAFSGTLGGENVDTWFTTQALSNGTVVYTYTPAAAVPEPETYGMLLVGLGLMGVVARRKSAGPKA